MENFNSTKNFMVLVIILSWSSRSLQQQQQQYQLRFESNPSLKTLPDKVKEKTLYFVNEGESYPILNETSNTNSSSSGGQQSNCKDPSYKELSAMFVDALVKNLDMLDIWFISSSHMHRKSHMLPDLGSNEDSFDHCAKLSSSWEGSKYCKRVRVNEMIKHKWTRRSNEEKSWYPLCPWEHKLTVRNSRFPYKRWVAVCNCAEYDDRLSLTTTTMTMKTTMNISESRTNRRHCMQMKTPMPVLVRGECERETNVYKWFFASEDISTACVCTKS